MRITLTGTGTSQGIPVIACDCEVCTSKDPRDNRLRAACVVETADITFAIDAGPDFRYQMLQAGIKHLDAVLFTHQHKDHTAGLDDVRPFIFKNKKAMDIYASSGVLTHLKGEFAYAFEENPYPGAPVFTTHEITTTPFQLGATAIIPIHTMHGKLPVFGFRIGKFAYVTDTNFIPEDSLALLQGLDVLVLDALRLSPHHSHFSLDEAIEVAQLLQAKKTYFTHISHLMGPHAKVSDYLPDSIALAHDGLKIEMIDSGNCKGIS